MKNLAHNCQQVVENARKIWRDNVLNVKIPHATLFSRSYDEKTPVSILDPQHPGAIAQSYVLACLLMACRRIARRFHCLTQQRLFGSFPDVRVIATPSDMDGPVGRMCQGDHGCPMWTVHELDVREQRDITLI